MEHGPHSDQRDADPAPGALADLRPECPQQPFDLSPSKIGRRRLCEDPGQGPSVPAVHLDMISEMDIGERHINHRAAAVFDFVRPSGIEEGSGDAASAEVVEEGLGFVEVGGVEAFSEPAEDRGTLEGRKRLRRIGRNNERYQQMLNELRRLVVFADEAGFEVFATTEHHFHSEGYKASVAPLLLYADLAARPKRIKFSPLGLVLPSWDPIRAAEEIAILDHLTKGRVYEIGRAHV